MSALKGDGAGRVEVRPAMPSDLEAIAAIYHHYVLHATCTFATEPESQDYWRNWFDAHVGAYPALVAMHGDDVVGWGSLSRWNTRCAYRFTAEDSVYIRENCRGLGIGRHLLSELIHRARASGLKSLVAQIADHQAASEQLHERAGFRRVGVLERVGYKFDRWIDVAIWQMHL